MVYTSVATEVQIPSNTSSGKETLIPTEKQGSKNTADFWSMKERGQKSEAMPFPHGQYKRFIRVPWTDILEKVFKISGS